MGQGQIMVTALFGCWLDLGLVLAKAASVQSRR